jgi:hypothetical protein
MNLTKLLSLSAAVALAASCATTTKIVTETPGAKVVAIDDKGGKTPVGSTPVNFETKMWIWEKQKLEVTSTSGQTKTVEVSRNEFDLVPGIGAIAITVCTGGGLICVGVPIFLAGGMKAPAETKVEFDKKTGQFERVPAPLEQSKVPAETVAVAF